MKEKKLSKDFTKGSIPKQMFWFMLPFMASNGLQVLYSTIDMIIVGRYVGTAGISAVALRRRPFWVSSPIVISKRLPAASNAMPLP